MSDATVVDNYVTRIRSMMQTKHTLAGDGIFQDVSETGAFYHAAAVQLLQEIIGPAHDMTVTVQFVNKKKHELEVTVPGIKQLPAAAATCVESLMEAFVRLV